MKDIILVGAGGHARSCIDVIEQEEKYRIVGLIDSNVTGGSVNSGYPIIGTDDNLAQLRQKYEYAIITIGQIKSAATRVKLFHLLSELEYNLPIIVVWRQTNSVHLN